MITTSPEYISYKMTLGSQPDYRENNITTVILCMACASLHRR
jgi:hypothetical protein